MIEAGQPLIQIQDMTKVFYTDEIETHALSGIHLSVKKGEYVAMSGPSGCGKSTLLSIIGLLDTPTAGRYSLNGKTVENLDFAERSRIRNQEIGFIFQSFNLIGDLTVYENVELPLTYRQKMPAADRKTRVMEALERVGMAHRVRHYPSQLSGGPAATRCRGPRARRETLDSPGRRADWKFGFAQRRGRDGTLAELAPRGRDHLHGHARSALRQACAARSAPVRRKSGGGGRA
jgi:predicted ABC-type transport system involved in lysophospholipase L1 biosynthesis ATPase subunit